ncbi:uncharacterized protein LOC122404106 [Colletes gigas]|uniref:uncharacterized protein LOC122404106 n=1 Tax=Colletes gigas TaxID=935657 RepID=UPI001C9B865A|nr:uncharacterized protein LOC122404106 [Colletes gigas]
MNNNDQKVKEIVLRDVEPVLQQKLGKCVIVKNFTTEPLLPPGENYGSTILKVDVELKNRNTGKKEDLRLIAKMLPPTEFQRLIFNSSQTFTKEIFMYETIVPAYNKLELESGIKESEISHILPYFYGSRLSLQPDGDIDDDAVFLMENLKSKGYYNGNRIEGYDLEHSEMAIKSLARFHALGMAMKLKKPEIFEVFKMHSKNWEVEGNSEDFFAVILKKIKDDPEMNPYYDKCYKRLNAAAVMDFWTDTPCEPWMTIIHSDLWVNNIMFHRNEKGQVEDVKFVDFQIYVYSSCVRDLLFYLFSSVKTNVTDEQLDILMDLYYDALVDKLNIMGCDTSSFNKEGFREKIAEDASREFLHLCFMIKILTLDIKESNFSYDNMQNVMVNYEGNQIFVERLRKIVLYFCKHNWI